MLESFSLSVSCVILIGFEDLKIFFLSFFLPLSLSLCVHVHVEDLLCSHSLGNTIPTNRYQQLEVSNGIAQAPATAKYTR